MSDRDRSSPSLTDTPLKTYIGRHDDDYPLINGNGCAARLNTTPPFTANKMLTLLEEACSLVTPDNWRKVVEKTKKLCLDDWDRDVRYDNVVDQPFLINVGESSCSSDSESETQAVMSDSD